MSEVKQIFLAENPWPKRSGIIRSIFSHYDDHKLRKQFDKPSFSSKNKVRVRMDRELKSEVIFLTQHIGLTGMRHYVLMCVLH